MKRPRLLDAFCGAGGTSTGYYRAGFDVVGVDIVEQPNYPFEFHCGDALEFIAKHGHEFAVLASSPPCQASSALTKGTNRATKAKNHVNLIPATRAALQAVGRPFVIENVQGAKVRRDLTLCGEMFGLGVIRHRYFEVDGLAVEQPAHVKHRGRVRGWRHGVYYDGVYWAPYGLGGGKGSLDDWRAAMDVPWMWTAHEITESVPPAYTEFVGRQIIAQVLAAAA